MSLFDGFRKKKTERSKETQKDLEKELTSVSNDNRKNNSFEAEPMQNIGPFDSFFAAVNESVTAYKMMEEDKQKNGEQTKRNVVYQRDHITLKANRSVMTKGSPADYYFEGDNLNKSATLPILAPLKINIEKALRDGIPGKSSWEGSKCILATENEDYRFFSYGCYQDGSGGCIIAQKKSDPKKVYFFGKARKYKCIYHNKLVQIDNSAYGTELYLYVKDINTGKERIYPWFGKYAIPTGRGSRYDQDIVKSMEVDSNSDSIVIKVHRRYYINPSSDDNESICNADTDYLMTVKDNGNDFHAIAEFPELNVSVIFNNQY